MSTCGDLIDAFSAAAKVLQADIDRPFGVAAYRIVSVLLPPAILADLPVPPPSTPSPLRGDVRDAMAGVVGVLSAAKRSELATATQLSAVVQLLVAVNFRQPELTVLERDRQLDAAPDDDSIRALLDPLDLDNVAVWLAAVAGKRWPLERGLAALLRRLPLEIRPTAGVLLGAPAAADVRTLHGRAQLYELRAAAVRAAPETRALQIGHSAAADLTLVRWLEVLPALLAEADDLVLRARVVVEALAPSLALVEPIKAATASARRVWAAAALATSADELLALDALVALITVNASLHFERRAINARAAIAAELDKLRMAPGETASQLLARAQRLARRVDTNRSVTTMELLQAARPELLQAWRRDVDAAIRVARARHTAKVQILEEATFAQLVTLRERRRATPSLCSVETIEKTSAIELLAALLDAVLATTPTLHATPAHQVAAVATIESVRPNRLCFHCGVAGHLRRACPSATSPQSAAGRAAAAAAVAAAAAPGNV